MARISKAISNSDCIGFSNYGRLASNLFLLFPRLCNGGELFDKITEQTYFSEHEAAKIIKQILSAVNYCHQRNIVHRDLKPENLLLNRDQKDPKVTIIDFGTSGIFEQN